MRVNVMDVLENASYEARNLVSYRGKMDSFEMRRAINRMREYISFKGATVTGPLITATYVIDGEGQMTETEIFLPVNKGLFRTMEFTYTPRFKIENCFMATHKGDPYFMPIAYAAIKEKLEELGMKMNPPFYHVYIRNVERREDFDLFEVDIYVPY